VRKGARRNFDAVLSPLHHCLPALFALVIAAVGTRELIALALALVSRLAGYRHRRRKT
jgi:hypothetical protein